MHLCRSETRLARTSRGTFSFSSALLAAEGVQSLTRDTEPGAVLHSDGINPSWRDGMDGSQRGFMKPTWGCDSPDGDGGDSLSLIL
jgi:hypothetical protein